MPEEKDYRESLNLPKTTFPMKAQLPKMEPQIFRKWEEIDIYGKIQQSRSGGEKFVLHDGPPYANGHVHLGTALNKILKDFIVKAKTMEGFNSPYVPGWDCHGMPIEHEVMKALGPEALALDSVEIRRKCRALADKFIGIQRNEFKRLGCFGRWGAPYITMSPHYEAEIIAAFRELVAGGYIYKGLRPIHWCITCATALAEAEVEYNDHASPSIYVKFPVPADEAEKILPALKGKKTSVIIWTTTPWTLPSNLAIAFHPDKEYVAFESDGEAYITASGLMEETVKTCSLGAPGILGTFPGAHLEGKKSRHPFVERDSVFILASYVTLDQGTGCVHTAPGHGREDFLSGMEYGLDAFSPVDDAGRFTAAAGDFAGLSVFDANDPIVEKLRSLGMLLHVEKITHAYPHCWRCKNPLIFRATRQWFLGVDVNDLRARLMEEIGKVKWIPEWGRDRIGNMVEVRPDWCLSRQRAWGVPIPVFTCKACGEPLLDVGLIAKVEARVRKEGADCWYTTPVDEFIGSGTSCAKCSGSQFEKEMNILDVWFDSSVSQRAVLYGNPDLAWPCDLYLEATDQHRGWFQVSLITAVATKGRAPYRSVLTHGLILDEKLRKMSKSLGNVIAPEEIIETYGADLLRLFFASVDYTADVGFSGKLFPPLVESYRKIRNTCRFILGNISDFDPAAHPIEKKDLRSVDRYALAVLSEWVEKIRAEYRNYAFHKVFHGLNHYCIVDLSSFYLDLLKDRLYTSGKDAPQRRAAQAVLYRILSAITRLMAPLLPFTAEEIWSHLPGAVPGDSVHLQRFPDGAFPVGPEEKADWEALLTVRDQVLKALEEARKSKAIGSSLEARVDLKAGPKIGAVLNRYRAELAELFIVSAVDLGEAPGAEEGLEITVGNAPGDKCHRCWKYLPSVGRSARHPHACASCTEVLEALEP
jgi:isoleucyl-tRNA synthetase